jgi:gas vesicle protein
MTDYERFGDNTPTGERGNLGIAITFLFVGLGLGALSALLIAPRSGKQMRRTLRRRYEDAVDTLGEWGEQAGGMVEKGSGWASDIKNKARDKVRPIARAVRRAE